MRKSVLLASSLMLAALLGFQKQATAQGMFVPTAYGAWGNTIFGGISIVSPGLYDKSVDEIGLDGLVSAGIGLGNPVKNFGFQAVVNRLAVLNGNRWGGSAQLSRYLGKGVALGLGADNILTWGESSAFTPTSWYLSVSQKLKYVKSDGFLSRLGYTLGVGTGRFGSVSPDEIEMGKGFTFYKDKHSATLIYGALSVDIMKWLEADVEWSGRNLHAGLAVNLNTKVPVKIIAGAADLTKFTGDGVRFFAGLGVAYQFKDVKYVTLDTKELEEKMDKAHKECMDKVGELKKDHEQILANQKALQDRLDNLEKQVQQVQNDQKAMKSDDPSLNSGMASDYAKDGSNLKAKQKGAKEGNSVIYDGSGDYVVVYSRRSLEEASALNSDLSKKGVNSEITTNKAKSWYHVYTHLFSHDQHKDALKKSTKQRRNGYVGSWVLVK